MAGRDGNETWKREKSKEVLWRFDGNEDGTLSLYKLMAAYKKMGVNSPVQRAYKALLSIDEDGDVRITKESEVATFATYLRVIGAHDVINKDGNTE